ncbi:MAG: hypothetical protein CMH53_01090, partial [Myxococcales bacterium]|nr:hypothetical protein [Myxococcales bacterium]
MATHSNKDGLKPSDVESSRNLESMMTHSNRIYSLALTLLLMAPLFAACVDQAEPSQPVMKLSFATLDSSCQKTVNGSNAIPSDITRLVAVLTRPDGQKSTHRAERSAVEASGTWHIKGINQGGPLSLEVFGCDASGSIKYAGQSQGIDVISQQKSSIRAFLAPVGTLACTGDASLADGAAGKSRGLPKPTSLASSVALSSGDVLVTGGLGSWLTTEQRGTATRQTAIYEHQVGHFRAGPNLSSPRVWHHTIALTATRALVVGGVTQLNAIGDNSLNAPVMMPKTLKQSWASPSTEVLDVEVESNGLAKPPIQSKADVGAGGNLLSAALGLADGVWFVGGLTQNVQASAEATYLKGFAALAEG